MNFNEYIIYKNVKEIKIYLTSLTTVYTYQAKDKEDGSSTVQIRGSCSTDSLLWFFHHCDSNFIEWNWCLFKLSIISVIDIIVFHDSRI